MGGATFAELPFRDVLADPKLLDRAGVTVCGVTRALRERLLAADVRGTKPASRAWFRSMNDVLDLARWDEFGRMMAERKLLSFALLVNAASGGVHLFTPRALVPPTLRVWPAPGREWQLSEPAGGAVPTMNDAGVYTVLVDGEPDPSLPRAMLGRHGDGYMFAGAMDLAPGGQIYPCADVSLVARMHPSVRHAVAILTGGRWMNDAKVALLLFTDALAPPDLEKPDVPIPEVRELLARELGERFIPDRIEAFPLTPRFVNGAVDAAWCRSQYLSGSLHAKARSELFRTLARVAYIFAAD